MASIRKMAWKEGSVWKVRFLLVSQFTKVLGQHKRTYKLNVRWLRREPLEARKIIGSEAQVVDVI
jgi:lipoate-protein ligase A